MNLQKYLPLGTVVLLKNASHRSMIIGFAAANEENANKIYDYAAVPYPEGLINTNTHFLFNHSDIDKVFYLGLSDEEEQNFKLKLVSTVNELVDAQGNLKNSNN